MEWTWLGPLLGVLLGAVGGHIVQSLSWKRDEVMATRLLLGETRQFLWSPTPFEELSNHTAKVRIRATGLGISRGVVDAFIEAALACWRDSSERAELGDPEAGIESGLLRTYDDLAERLDLALLSRARVRALFG